MKVKNPFEIEKLRTQLAENNQIDDLKKTYTSNFTEIRNKNTPTLWDKLNRRETQNEDVNYMEKDKLLWVAHQIPLKESRILNIGFGSANLEDLKLKKNNYLYKWYGIDISKESVDKAQRKFPTAKFRQGEITKLKFTNNKFDFVIALEVLEHISPTKILQAYREINRVLKVGGIFICSVPLNEDLEKMILNNENFNEHVRIYTPKLIKAELEICEFKIIKSKLIFAFKKYYYLKTILVNHLIRNYRQPNGIVVVSKKI